MKKQRALCFALLALTSLLIISTSKVTPVKACYGPHITANISKTEVNLNDTVTIAGEICPPEPNVTVRVTFTRPDYTWIDQFVTADPETDIEQMIKELLTKNDTSQNIQTEIHIENDAQIVRTDSAYMKRILGNLFSNAVQAMPNGGTLIFNAKHENGSVTIKVEDTGIGISEEARDKLFTPLFTTKSKGQGFGLAVVKRLTEALGGTVTFESEEGKGSKFIIRLPSIKNNARRSAHEAPF